jgi:hypothetical protein
MISMPMAATSSTNYASEIASFVAEQQSNSFYILQNSYTLGFIAKGTYQQLGNVFTECSSAGWDGERAKPVSEEIALSAVNFLKSFPIGIEAPEIGCEPDGAITLEWYRSPNRIISISVDANDQIYYAAIIGASTQNGSNFSSSGVSEDLLKLISQVIS